MNLEQNLNARVTRFITDGDEVVGELLWEYLPGLNIDHSSPPKFSVFQVDLYRYQQPSRAETVWRDYLAKRDRHQPWDIMDQSLYAKKHNCINNAGFAEALRFADAGLLEGNDGECVVGVIESVIKKDNIIYFRIMGIESPGMPEYFNDPDQSLSLNPMTLNTTIMSKDTHSREPVSRGFLNQTSYIAAVMIDELKNINNYQTHQWVQIETVRPRPSPRTLADLSECSHVTKSVDVHLRSVKNAREEIEREMAARNNGIEPKPPEEPSAEELARIARDAEEATARVAKENAENDALDKFLKERFNEVMDSVKESGLVVRENMMEPWSVARVMREVVEEKFASEAVCVLEESDEK